MDGFEGRKAMVVFIYHSHLSFLHIVIFIVPSRA
jgi:hypothetical protein